MNYNYKQYKRGHMSQDNYLSKEFEGGEAKKLVKCKRCLFKLFGHLLLALAGAGGITAKVLGVWSIGPVADSIIIFVCSLLLIMSSSYLVASKWGLKPVFTTKKRGALYVTNLFVMTIAVGTGLSLGLHLFEFSDVLNAIAAAHSFIRSVVAVIVE